MINKKIVSVFVIVISLFVIFSLALSISSCTSKGKAADNINYPTYSGFVNDYTSTLTEEWKTKTEQLTASVERQTSCEIAVAVIDSLNGISVEEYAVRLFNKWGVGKKDKDNGALLLIAMADHKLRIEVGYGLEGTITDLEVKEIIDNVIVPRFKENDYNSGIYNGVVAIANKIYEEEGKAGIAYSDNSGEISNSADNVFVPTPDFILTVTLSIFFPLFVMGMLLLILYFRFHKCPRCHKIGLIIKQTILVKPTYNFPGRAEIEQRCKYCGYYERKTITIFRSSRYPFISSSFSHYGSSGSSHSSSSFGGGTSGGGGASGSW